jgi:hypothetical protein
MITYYGGRDIRELSREELIEALVGAAKEIESAYAIMGTMNRMNASFDKKRKQLNG